MLFRSLAKLLVVPAERLMEPWVEATVTVAVTVLPLSPNETLFEFDSTNADRLLLVVPADRFTFVKLVAMLAVIVCPLVPNVTPLELLNTTVPEVYVVAALMAIPLIALTEATLAVKMVEFPAARNPKLTPLELEKLTVLVDAVDPPAAIPRMASPPPAATDAVTVWPSIPNVTPFALE